MEGSAPYDAFWPKNPALHIPMYLLVCDPLGLVGCWVNSRPVASLRSRQPKPSHGSSSSSTVASHPHPQDHEHLPNRSPVIAFLLFCCSPVPPLSPPLPSPRPPLDLKSNQVVQSCWRFAQYCIRQDKEHVRQVHGRLINARDYSNNHKC